MKKIYIFLAIYFLFVQCTTQKDVVFSDMKYSIQDDYGYSENNPIMLGYHRQWRYNMDLINEYVGSLKYQGQPLKFHNHYRIYQKGAEEKQIIPAKKYIMFKGHKTILDIIVVKPVRSSDTLNLYFDLFHPGIIKIPKHMTYDPNLKNNIYY